MEKFRTAVLYGADAVYLGGSSGNLRASSRGFDGSELREAVVHAERHGVRVYYCLNSLPFERDMPGIPPAAAEAAEAGVHAFIVADPGVLRLVKRAAPGVPVHVSTQANTTNAEAVRFWTDNGAARIVLARELSCRDIHAVRKALPDTELEVFVHGAMCLAVSGQCLLSAWLNNRPANQGRCTQPCRFEYRAVEADFPPSLVLEEALRDGKRLWTVEQGEPYAEIFAPDDLCLLPYLPWFIHNRITALKIEGRMKGSSYVAHVTDAFRAAIDAACSGEKTYTPASFLPDLVRAASRPLSTGFFLPGRRLAVTPQNAPVSARPLLGRVAEPYGAGKGAWLVEVRGKWRTSQPVELMLPGMRRPVMAPCSYALENHRGERADEVNSGTRAVLYTDTGDIRPGIFLRGLEF